MPWIFASGCINAVMVPYRAPLNILDELAFRTRYDGQAFNENHRIFHVDDFRIPGTDQEARGEMRIDQDDPYSLYVNEYDPYSVYVKEDWYNNWIELVDKEWAGFRKGAEDIGVLGAIMTAAGMEIGASIVPYSDYFRNPARGAAKYILKPYAKQIPHFPWISTNKKDPKKSEVGSGDHSSISEYLGGLSASMAASVAVAKVNAHLKRLVQGVKSRILPVKKDSLPIKND